MADNTLNRRQFLSTASIAGTGLLLSGTAPRFFAPKAATKALDIPIKKQKKAEKSIGFYHARWRK